MADNTGIAWCHATLNPCYGCFPISPACSNCYAQRQAARLGRLTEGTHRHGKWTGKINLFPERMEQALRWKRPRRIFVGSMTDLFHENVPNDFLDKVFAYMALAPQHTFIVLTKRPARMRGYLSQRYMPVAICDALVRIGEGMSLPLYPPTDGLAWPFPNVILMATTEDQPRVEDRIPHLMAMAGMGWRTGISVEPMLGPVDLRNFHDPYDRNAPGLSSGHDWLTGEEWSFSDIFGGGPNWIEGDDYGKRRLHWVICGCESGPNAHPMDSHWARSLRDQCVAASVPFFFKQEIQNAKLVHTPELNGKTWTQFP